MCEKTEEWAIEQGLQVFSIKLLIPERHYFWKERKGKEKRETPQDSVWKRK